MSDHVDLAPDPNGVPVLGLRRRAAARSIGIGERTLDDLTRRGVIPHIRLGRKVVIYPIAALQRWLEEQAQPARTGDPK
jgi:excisionase family DNA binding protein